MIKLTIIGIIALNSFIGNNVGTATNQHYIEYNNGTGYYIENELDICKGDKIVIVEGEVYVVDREVE